MNWFETATGFRAITICRIGSITRIFSFIRTFGVIYSSKIRDCGKLILRRWPCVFLNMFFISRSTSTSRLHSIRSLSIETTFSNPTIIFQSFLANWSFAYFPYIFVWNCKFYLVININVFCKWNITKFWSIFVRKFPINRPKRLLTNSILTFDILQLILLDNFLLARTKMGYMW